MRLKSTSIFFLFQPKYRRETVITGIESGTQKQKAHHCEWVTAFDLIKNNVGAAKNDCEVRAGHKQRGFPVDIKKT